MFMHLACSDILKTLLTVYRQLYEARRRANGERVLPNPVYRCLGDTTDETMSENSSETDDDELLIEGTIVWLTFVTTKIN